MTTNTTHTPTPWTWAGYAGGNEPANFSILTKDTYQQPGSELEQRVHIGDIFTTPSDAAHIVQCVNEREELLATLNLALATLERAAPARTHGRFSTVQGTIDVVRRMITRAEQEG